MNARMVNTRLGSLLILLAASSLVVTEAFAPSSVSRWGNTKCSVPAATRQKSVAPTTKLAAPSTTALEAKLWDRLQIEEDPEPMWYLVNCVAGLEMDLLRQCREICKDMPDALKFVVPTEIKTRSHGANRMVTETKVKYLGYVFAKIRLCPDVYEAIQDLDLCRSWMGTVNHKGYKKLPPSPLALNELEVENFNLEEIEFTEEEEDENPDIIVDTAEEEAKKKPKVDEEALKVYLGLRVNDMIKVTAKNKFFDEDGIVRRLKDGKIFVRFYTYGTLFEEWLDPTDMRPLSDMEVVKGLSGPSKPVTQEDLDGPQDDRFGRPSDGGRQNDLRRGLTSDARGADRNRRQDRTERGDRSRRDKDEESYRNDKNWNWYKDQQESKDGGDAADSDWKMRAGSKPDTARRNRAGQDEWALGDADSQWGRKPQRQERREQKTQQNRQENRQAKAAIDGSDDWSSFVSPAGGGASGSASGDSQSDDFFESLMTDLSKDLGDQSGGASSSQSTAKPSNDQKDEDDFFASLMTELSDEPSAPVAPPPRRAPPQQRERAPARRQEELPTLTTSADEDFFAALEAELGNAFEETPAAAATTTTGGGSDESDDFFAKLEAELAPVQEAPIDAMPATSLDDRLETKSVATKTIPVEVTDAAPKRSGTPSANGASGSFDKCTVPVLKDMLRERGLKVSGKKSELIERLSQAS